MTNFDADRSAPTAIACHFARRFLAAIAVAFAFLPTPSATAATITSGPIFYFDGPQGSTYSCCANHLMRARAV